MFFYSNSGIVMLLVWGKRTYGAVHRVDNVAIKTVFGHFWYLPLFPMTSYYIDTKTDAAFELNGLNGRSVLCGYLRVWLPLLILGSLMAMQSTTGNPAGFIVMLAIGVAAFIGTYAYDKKSRSEDSIALRKMMGCHFGVALDPYQCMNNLQQQIDGKMRAIGGVAIDETWYKAALNDSFTGQQKLQLAVLRARCDQHDACLQELVVSKLQQAA